MSLVLVALTVRASADEPSLTADQQEHFETKIRPLLVERCLDCHGPDTQEGELRLDRREHILKGGRTGPAAKPGDPTGSLLVTAVRRTGKLQMPPDDPLDADQVALLSAWIADGMPWPAATPVVPEQSRQQRYQQMRETHWAFQPIGFVPPPTVTQSQWIRSPIDAFVLARLEQAGLTPSPEVDRATYIRRATFDLHGLPPTAEDVQQFVHDREPEAHARLIDRLLASPRYGERWGRYWLDVARYADTRGYSFGRERRFPYSYTYRDYVIDAFNRDLPYDRFLLEQLAADLVPTQGTASDLDRNGDESMSLAALGFLTVGRKFNNRHDDIDDQIDVVSRGLLGLTVSCARCHDHKYDAIPTEDYYSLYGIFASSDEPDALPILGRPEDTPGYAQFKQELDRRREALQTFVEEKCREYGQQARQHATDYLVRAVTTEPEQLLQKLPFISLGAEELKPKLVNSWRQYLLRSARADHPVWGPLSLAVKIPDNTFAEQVDPWLDAIRQSAEGTDDGQLNPQVKQLLIEARPTSKIDTARVYGQLLTDVYGRWQQRQQGAAEISWSPADEQLVQILIGSDSPAQITAGQLDGLLTREDNNKHRELQRQIDSHQVNSDGAPPRAMVVEQNRSPHDPRVFERGNHARLGEPVPRRFLYVLEGDQRQAYATGGRWELAQAIVARDNPLTARVIVNRVWMHHFIEPLVATPSDFGVRSEPPTHPELLDYLANQFRQQGWSLKQLHRELMLSSTYRQASQPRGECASIDPENRLLWRMHRRRLDWEALRDSLLAVSGQLDLQVGGKSEPLTSDQSTHRRAVYGYIDRQDLPNLLRVFDFASPDQSSPRRPRTTVPQQSLFLMNSPFAIDQARALVKSIEAGTAETDEQRVQALYGRLFGRPAAEEEVQLAIQFLQQQDEQAVEGDQLQPWEQYVQLLLLTNEFVFID